MELKEVTLREFKEIIYPEYVKLFPSLERKTYKDIEKSVDKDITDIIEIVVDNQFVGFIIINTLKDNPYVQLDYLAILPNYQNKGYGTQAIKLLKEQCKDYCGIFIEIEKIGLGQNEEENKIREKRAKFYENLGFYKLNFNLDLYTIIYSAYMLPCQEKRYSDEEVIDDIFKIYNAILGEKRVKKHCRVIV